MFEERIFGGLALERILRRLALERIIKCFHMINMHECIPGLFLQNLKNIHVSGLKRPHTRGIEILVGFLLDESN